MHFLIEGNEFASARWILDWHPTDWMTMLIKEMHVCKYKQYSYGFSQLTDCFFKKFLKGPGTRTEKHLHHQWSMINHHLFKSHKSHAKTIKPISQPMLQVATCGCWSGKGKRPMAAEISSVKKSANHNNANFIAILTKLFPELLCSDEVKGLFKAMAMKDSTSCSLNGFSSSFAWHDAKQPNKLVWNMSGSPVQNWIVYTTDDYHSPWRIMVGRLPSYCEGNFSGATVDGRNPAPPGMYKTL